MEIVGGIILSLVALVLLAALGLTTVVALALMMTLGLLTEMSFKRLFFVSFGLGLLAPLLLGAASFAAIADGSLERDLRRDLGDIVQLPEDGFEGSGDWQDRLEDLRDLQRDMDDGDMSDEEIEARVKQLFGGKDGVPLQIEGDKVIISEDGATITLDTD